MQTTNAVAPQVDPSAVAADQLRSLIERIERLEEEKAGVAGDIKDVFAEAKGNGFDVKVMRKIIAMRKRDHSERQEEEAILELYMQALGMLSDTPLGHAAARRDFGDGAVDRHSARAVGNRSLRDAVKAMGTPLPLTDEERASGGIAAFDQNGMRCSISIGSNSTLGMPGSSDPTGR